MSSSWAPLLPYCHWLRFTTCSHEIPYKSGTFCQILCWMTHILSVQRVVVWYRRGPTCRLMKYSWPSEMQVSQNSKSTCVPSVNDAPALLKSSIISRTKIQETVAGCNVTLSFKFMKYSISSVDQITLTLVSILLRKKRPSHFQKRNLFPREECQEAIWFPSETPQ